MPDGSAPGRWRGWWEGVVDLVPKSGGSRTFSLERLFGKGVPQAFSEAESSVLRLVVPEGLRMEPDPTASDGRWKDGRFRNVTEWDLLQADLQGKNIQFWWDGEDKFQHRKRS
jgi:phosphatidylinositol glycan class T